MVVENRLEKEKPAVGMETTVFVHGLPRKEAIELFRKAKKISEEMGFQLAVVGVLKGKIILGMNEDELTIMMNEGSEKIGTREIPIALAKGMNAATTVSATIFLCKRFGIDVVVTGGTGGVHPGGVDISQDLTEMASSRIILVSSGIKSILDVDATFEMLETLEIPVVGFMTDEFPLFFSRKSGKKVKRVENVEEILRIYRTMEELKLEKTLMVLNPVPEEHEVPREEIEHLLENIELKVEGKDVTPYLLRKLVEITGGRTLKANLSLLEENVKLAGKIALALGR
ncbi:pseudouridine-5'-phosphate glycosidase [Thermotoga neapolitana]|jgi:pseudouridine-5'-phosphate glycosidase|uniref:Pseudouridine-5'-phosphate glycosidase n=1 Tax=Thermotoga neapolitana (strain ATCC 49049 / DSM 4359 / NBRC 107923 / NS-E) TaxID=309803 RepID=PSUG_THENN|nr:pseudouridine-5'-phosphate glycosidase [Thermotoga neapolitana]B9K8C2.1 RecName: Full=Pseudouridine-5'-phosphate glycosidase; Short=PsiMP glycosidase [Thermotoga neapolitana DSM 4359]ACM23205.1 Indigoidine synthase A family protein [Thermotoga neapolitana DSM 4359]KFZ21709.1 Indigoidine synthase A family protein [Thermotoga neapolitana LA10]HBF11515.1 pseudouridine-5'-phosphate glycosidase [Thermotoga neapolitana]